MTKLQHMRRPLTGGGWNMPRLRRDMEDLGVEGDPTYWGHVLVEIEDGEEYHCGGCGRLFTRVNDLDLITQAAQYGESGDICFMTGDIYCTSCVATRGIEDLDAQLRSGL